MKDGQRPLSFLPGSGPCLFCGDLVCTKEEQEVLGRGSRKSESLLKKLLGPDADSQSKANYEASLSKAEQHKNTLLEYDATCEKRTQVRKICFLFAHKIE